MLRAGLESSTGFTGPFAAKGGAYRSGAIPVGAALCCERARKANTNKKAANPLQASGFLVQPNVNHTVINALTLFIAFFSS